MERGVLRLVDRLEGRNNAIDHLRLGAALLVVLGHSWHISLGPQAIVPFEHYTLFGFHELAVHIFFFLSGLLVTESARGHIGRPIQYGFRRFRRIFPGLLANAIVVPIVLIAAGAWTGVSFAELANYIFRLVTLFSVQFTHEGAFAGLPFEGAINGSVWSLRHEIVVYVLLAGAAAFGALQTSLRRTIFLSAIAVLSIAGFVAKPYAEGGALFVLAEGRFVYVSFLLGVLAHQFARYVPLNWTVLVPGAVVLAVAHLLGGALIIEQLAVIYLVCGLTLLVAYPRFEVSGLKTDLSYGVYIYSWPLQQLSVFVALTVFGVSLSPMGVLFACIGPVLLFALASWHWVEKPALRTKLPVWPKVSLRSRFLAARPAK